MPSLTPAKTERLWQQLVDRPRALTLSRTAVCATPVRAVFYAPTDWLRLATKLAANPSPCTDYYISIPALAADKTQLRTDQAWRIRALGSQFHALAEVNVSGWSGWVTANGGSWHAAGVEARRRLAAAGYEVAAGDSWVVNELSSAVRQGIGNARANMRDFVRGLYEGEGVAARGAVFVVGMSQATTELSVYQSRLQDWYEDAPFWEDMSRYVSDWTQELYGDVRTWAAPGTDASTRAAALNDYLQHELTLARVAPGSGAAAASFLSGAYVPLGNAAWAYDSAFGWTDVPAELMQSYVSSQVAAMKSYRDARLGFAWTPKNLHAVATADFNAQTDALLDRLAAAIAGADPCAPSSCGGDLDGAAFNRGWQTFAAWKPSALAFATAPQTLPPGTASAALTVQLQTNTGVAYTAGLPVPVTFTSTSGGGSFSTTATGPWSSQLTVEIASESSGASVYYRDSQAGSPTITASAAGKAAATQTETVSPVASPPTTPSGFFVGFAEDLPKEIGSEAVTPATQLGASAFRLTLTWSPGQTSLTSTEAQKLDRAVAAASGARIVLAVYGANADAAPTDATRRDQYCGYVSDVLGRYSSIRDVVIWNEPNKSLFWRPQVNADGSVASPADYQALLARCWDVLHAAYPNVNVLGLALSSTGNDDSGSRSPGDFIRRVGDAFRASGRSGRILDTVAYHPYPTAASERPWRKHIGSKVIGMGDWNKLMYNLWLAFNGTAQPIPGEADVRLWYTEMGFQTAVAPEKAGAYTGTENIATVPDWAGGEPETPAPAETSAAPDQGTQALDAIKLAACQPHVGAFFNFLLADEPILAGWQSGPLWADRTPKRSWDAFRSAIALATSGGVDCAALKGGQPSGDFMPPAPPAEISATPAREPLRVDLAWSASTGDSSPVSYRIYRNGAWIGTTAETSWSNTTVAEGASYTYTVRAIDAAGNLGDASAAATATVPDVTAPTVSLTAPADGARVRGTVALEATAADNLGLARVELLVNDSVVATIASPPYAASWSSNGVADGTATISARAFDNAGNVAIAAPLSITVDNTPPQATITSGPAASTGETSAGFSFSASEADVTFQCSLDASPFAACASPQTYSGLAGGEHRFQVRATDAAGNVQPAPAEQRWTIVIPDTQAPETTLASGPSGTTTSTAASFAFSASEAGATFECALDDAPYEQCASPRAYSGLSGGSHTFAVRARDAAGNVDSSPATRAWTIFNDAFAAARPLLGASGSVSGSNGGATNEAGEPNHAGDRGGASVWFTWTPSASGPVTIDTRGSSFDTLLAVYTGSSISILTTVAANNNDGALSTSRLAFTASAGTVYRIAVDGRRGRTGSYTLNWSQSTSTPPPPGDTTPPDTAITSGPSGTVTATDASFGFTATEPGSTFECRLDAATFTACASPRTYSALASGTHTFEVRAVDSSGNRDGSPAARTWTISGSTSTSNDMFADAQPLAAGSGTVTDSTVGTSKEAGEPNHAGNPGGRSIWFTWTAPKTATVTFDTIGSPYDTLLAAYTGSAVGALTARAANDDASGLQSRISFAATAGVTYRIAVDGYNGASGSVTLNWSQP